MRVLERLKSALSERKRAEVVERGGRRGSFLDPRHWTIATQLVVGFGVLTLLLTGSSFASHVLIRTIHEDVTQILDGEPLERAVLEMEISVGEIARAVSDYVLDEKERHLARMHDSRRDFERYAEQFERLVESEEERKLGHQVSVLYADFRALSEEITSISKQRNADLLVFRTDDESIDDLMDEKLQPAIDRSGAHALTKLEAALEIEVNIDEAFAAIEGYVLIRDPDLLRKIADSEEGFERFLAQYRATPLSADEEIWLDVIERDFHEAAGAGSGIIALTDQFREKLLRFGADLEEIDRILDNEIQPLIRARMLELRSGGGFGRQDREPALPPPGHRRKPIRNFLRVGCSPTDPCARRCRRATCHRPS